MVTKYSENNVMISPYITFVFFNTDVKTSPAQKICTCTCGDKLYKAQLILRQSTHIQQLRFH